MDEHRRRHRQKVAELAAVQAPKRKPTATKHEEETFDPKIDSVLQAVTEQFSRDGLTGRQLDELRRRLKKELRQRVVKIGLDVHKAQRKRQSQGNLSREATASLATMHMSRHLRNLFEPDALRKDFQRCAEVYETELKDQGIDVRQRRKQQKISQRKKTDDASEPSSQSEAPPQVDTFKRLLLTPGDYTSDEPISAEHSAPLKERTMVRKPMTRLTPNIVNWINAYKAKVMEEEEEDLPLQQRRRRRHHDVVLEREAPRKSIRERYLMSILKSMIIRHAPGNTILQDYPVPETFVDALTTFADAEPASVKKLGFASFEVKLEDKKLLLFRPLPYLDLDDIDDGSALVMRLRPAMAPGFARSLVAGADDARAACDELRWDLQQARRSEITDLVKQLDHLDDRSLEAPLDMDDLGRLAITGQLGSMVEPPTTTTTTPIKKPTENHAPSRSRDGGFDAVAMAVAALEAHPVLSTKFPPWLTETTRRSSRVRVQKPRSNWATLTPVPLSYDVLARMDVVWRKLQIDEIDRLDFLCKHAHPDFSSRAPKVVTTYEALLDATETIHQTLTVCTDLLPTLDLYDDNGTAWVDAADHVNNLSDALSTASAALVDLFHTFDEDLRGTSSKFASDLPAAARTVLNAVPPRILQVSSSR